MSLTASEDNITLTDVVTPEILRPLSTDPVVQTQVEPHLPPTSERLDVVLTSPQFQQALGTFSGALQSGQLGPLMGQFGLGGDVVSAANTGSELVTQVCDVTWLRFPLSPGVDGFAEALQSDLGEKGEAGGQAAGGQEGGEPSKEKEKEKEKDGDEKKPTSSS